MDNVLYFLAAIVMTGAVTFLERAVPFFASKRLEKLPVVASLGRFLPTAIIALLVIHGAWSAHMGQNVLPGAELIALAATAALQWFTRQPFLSIFGGAALYVVLLNWG